MILTREMTKLWGGKNIVVPKGVTELEKGCFSFSDFETIEVPNTVKSIGERAFEHSCDLKSVIIPDGVKTIGKEAFKDCWKLEDIIIPDSVKTIGVGAFSHCSRLKTVTINVDTCLETSVFENCYNLQEVRGTIKNCSPNLFRDCERLTTVNLSKNIRNIQYGSFWGCKNLKEIELPNKIENIEDCAFSDCTNLTEIKLPDTVKHVGQWGFNGCKNLKEIKIPDGIETIGICAFGGIEGKVQIPTTFIQTGELSAELQALIPHNLGYVSREWGVLMTQLLELGIHPISFQQWKEPTRMEINALSELFKKKFGRAPKVVADIATAIKIHNLSIEEVVKAFSVEGFKEALRLSDNCPFVAIVALVGAGKNLLHKFPIHISYELGLSTPKIKNWVRKHPDSYGLLPKIKGLEDLLTEDTSVSEVKNLLAQVRATSDLEKIEKEYAFDFAQVKCEIKSTSVSKDSLSAYILEPTDYRQVTVGYDTCCCQHYGGAGETAMLYGLMCPTAGFWVIEDPKGAIKAQAEVWLSKDGRTFVFDNIEFANDREVSDFEDIIKTWVRECPYPNVVLGMGYTEIKLPCPECTAPPQPQVAALWDVYTDTHRCVCLKKEGQLTW